ncbi:class I SAM-dependent methyltransferase [Shewanella sp. NIFS-20-20]|uniref:class I SAM-dependent methyltransferase n=1 Tax=Shewanella sp. NIFS-20-20 TaxID=2853806 RepID=UPI001C480108|nr:class I SAM-dependent methyltransferase [Shewanella sp. NIFS-20-20]MBV7316375.1 class I SAM-dependent methyltransferase [Shewanella sp. NIFS-20-20]
MRTLIYGTSSKLLTHLAAISINHNIIGFIDSTPKASQWLNKPLYSPDQINNLEYDRIIIASSYVEEIAKTLASYGINNFINLDDDEQIHALHQQICAQQCEIRTIEEAKIPKIPLASAHIHDTRLITNRVELLNLLPKHGVAVELGVAQGTFSQQILTYNQPSKLHLVDIWGSNRYNDALFASVSQKFAAEVRDNQVAIHRQLSQHALADFDDNSLDWAYIDTTHSYQQTKTELELLHTKIKANGFICGHDYQHCNWASQVRYGVIEAVHEFCVAYQYKLVYLTMNISESQSFALQKIDPAS